MSGGGEKYSVFSGQIGAVVPVATLGTENEAVTTAWAAEADQRYAAWQRGEMPDVDGPAAVDRIRRGLA